MFGAHHPQILAGLQYFLFYRFFLINVPRNIFICMNLYPLIFSNNSNYRLARHSVFWFMWIIYYTIMSTYGMKPELPLLHRFFASLTEVSLSTPMDMIFCYSIIYFLLPKFLFQGRYISMILLWLLFSIIFIVVFELYVAQAVPYIRSWFGLPRPMRHSSYDYVFFSLFSQINMEGCMAAAIKLGKISFIKQKEIDLLRNEKTKLQAQTGRAEMQPVFLADIIYRLEQMATYKSVDIPGLLAKIRNFMTQIFYENSNAKFSLKKELELVSEYVELERCCRDEEIEVNLSVSGNVESENIASFILLQCIQNALNQLSSSNISPKKLDISINVASRMLTVLISWNKPLHTSTLAEGQNIIPGTVNKRFKLIYPESHEIKILIEPNKIIVSIKIDLKAAIN